jgi:conjugal transfer ATP-binding protein TraC
MMAPSGSGKSFFLQELVQSMLAQDVAVFVMDIGASYKNICKLLGGEMVRFNKDNDISLNPFATLSSSGAIYAKALELLKEQKSIEEIADITGLSEEKIEALQFGQKNATLDAMELDGIELLEVISKKLEDDSNDTAPKKYFITKDSVIYAKSMVAAMCGVSGKGREEAIIERAIVEGIAIYGDNLDVTKMAKILDSLKDNRGNPVEGSAAMADSLYSYTEEGIHGRFFKASSKTATFKEMLTIFELEELVNDEPLLAVVLQVILMQITMQFLCGDRTRRFILIVDEAWMILDYAAHFLERFARTVRKYGGSLVVCTQDLTSFSNENGDKRSQAAVLECSTWKLILQQKEEGIQSFAKNKAYQKYIGVIESVRKCSSNKFSEVLINTDGATVVGRFSADPYSTALFSTEDKDFTFLLEQEKLGVSKHEAILKLAKKYGELPALENENVDA